MNITVILFNLNPLSLTHFDCLRSITLNSTYDIVCHVNINFHFDPSDIHPLLHEHN